MVSIDKESMERADLPINRDVSRLWPKDQAIANDIKKNRPEPLCKPKAGNGGKQLSGHIRDVRACIRRIPSIEGQGGDKACFRVACLVAEAGFSFDEALAEMIDWNQTNALPPWETTELARTLRYAFSRVLGA